MWDPVQSERQNPLFKKQQPIVFSFFLGPPSQPVIVFFICYSALCSFGRVGTQRECWTHRQYDSVLDSISGHKNITNPSRFLHQSGCGGGEWERKGSSGHWMEQGASHEGGPGFQASGVHSIVPLDFTYKT